MTLPPGTAPRVLQWRYMFSATASIPPSVMNLPDESVVQLLGLTPCIVVATAGAMGDWAAYIAGVPLGTRSPEDADDQVLADVASWGYKLTEEQALGFFPMLGWGRRYRP